MDDALILCYQPEFNGIVIYEYFKYDCWLHVNYSPLANKYLTEKGNQLVCGTLMELLLK